MRDLLTNKYLWAIFLVYLCTAIFSVGHLYPDEYYQILEFAAYKLHLSSPHGLTWEFYAQIRSSIQAFMVVYLYKCMQYFTHGVVNPFVVAFITRALSAILSIYAAYLAILCFNDNIKSPKLKKYFILLSFFAYLAVINGVRYSSENISGKLFLIGMCLILLCQTKDGHKPYLKYLFYGFLLGLSFVVRYQVGIMILGFLAWLYIVAKYNNTLLVMLIIGILLAIVLGVIVDRWFYGNWVITEWGYFVSNIVHNKASFYGTSPWYFYASIAGFLPYGLLYVVCTVYFVIHNRTHVATWVMVPFLFVHILIPHKELRFLTPLLGLMPIVVIQSIQTCKRYKIFKLHKLAWYLNCIVLLGVMFTPAAMQISINKLLYNNYHFKTDFYYITEGGNILDFYKRSNLNPIQIDNINQIQCHNACLVALTCFEDVKYQTYIKSHNGEQIFSDCPAWIFKLDFNGWLERTALYNIYQLSPYAKHT